jgi:hypothetical protein
VTEHTLGLARRAAEAAERRIRHRRLLASDAYFDEREQWLKDNSDRGLSSTKDIDDFFAGLG